MKFPDNRDELLLREAEYWMDNFDLERGEPTQMLSAGREIMARLSMRLEAYHRREQLGSAYDALAGK